MVRFGAASLFLINYNSLDCYYLGVVTHQCFCLQDMEVTYFHSYIDGVDFVFIDSPNFRHLQDNIYRGSREVVIYFCWVEEYFHCWGQREKKCGEKTVLFCELFVSSISKMVMTLWFMRWMTKIICCFDLRYSTNSSCITIYSRLLSYL